jgi:Cytochrome c554 and c-prime
MPTAASSAADAAQKPSSFAIAYPAVRCSECHEPMHDQWKTSAHARAAKADLFTAMRAHAGPGPGAACDPCHLPLKGKLEPGDLAIGEGVTCEACHAIKDVVLLPDATSARVAYSVGDHIERGPICDAPDHYFHKMGCSPLHRESRICGGCHQWSEAKVPIFTEFDEWERGPSAKAGISCQDCHMPTTTAEVARGSPPRPGVPNHSFMGTSGSLVDHALAITLEVRRKGPAIDVDATLVNQGAGHSVPSGLPGRQLILRLLAVDRAGHELDRAERTYARVLVDERGVEVPFPAARSQKVDTRIAAGEQRREAFSLTAKTATLVRAEVALLELSPAIADALGRPPPDEHVFARAEVPLGAGGRAVLSKKVTFP